MALTQTLTDHLQPPSVATALQSDKAGPLSAASGNSPGKIEVVLQSPVVSHPNWPEVILPSAAWPMAVIIIVLLLRRALTGALGALLSRMSKFSLGGFAIELETAAARSSSAAVLDELRDVASDASFADSSNLLKSSLAAEKPADYAVVNLGAGKDWLTSRLYLLASLAARMRSIRLVVVIGTKDGRTQYLGAAECDKLQWALASRYPWLEVAFCKAFELTTNNLLVPTMERGEDPFGSDGRLNESGFAFFIRNYKQALQLRNTTQPPSKPGTTTPATSWSEIGSQVWERGVWVTESLLTELVGQDFSRPVPVRDLATTNEEFAKEVLRANSDLVPEVDNQRALRQVIKRRDFVNRIARRIADEH
jgi:hypothetical protein